MEPQLSARDKRTILRKDVLFACSMLLVYCLFISGLMAVLFWGSRENLTIRSTAAASTAVALKTEQAGYSFIEPFDNNREDWLTQSANDEYSKRSISINGGVYMWNITDVKQRFLYWANANRAHWVEDFDAYVDTMIKPADGTPGEFCSGFVFRTASVDWEEGAYSFSVCNNSYFDVDYYKQEEWHSIADWTYSEAFRVNDWNRLAISARGSNFTFRINDEVVYEMTDDRLPMGGLGLLIEVNEERPVSIWFDNFGFQER